jgi:alkylation response protein AidB-like acyl-CoA dehydrogenase
LLDLSVVAEAFGARAVPGPFLAHVLAALAISEGGTEKQRERWLPALVSGEQIGTLAFKKAGPHWPPEARAHISCPATTPPPAINLQMSHVLYPQLADVIVVVTEEGRLLLVEQPGDHAAFGNVSCMDISRRTSYLVLADAPATELDMDASRLRDAALVLLASDAFGGASRCVGVAVAFALERKQFGNIIGRFQALQHQLANMAVDVEPARGLYWYAAHAFDAAPSDSARMAALAKAHIGDRYLQVARDATEVHGGIGYTWDYPLHIWLKRAVFDRMYLGASAEYRRRSAQLAGWC